MESYFCAIEFYVAGMNLDEYCWAVAGRFAPAVGNLVELPYRIREELGDRDAVFVVDRVGHYYSENGEGSLPPNEYLRVFLKKFEGDLPDGF